MRSRELGDGLRAQMHAARLTGKDAARHLGCSPSWVSRLLSGTRPATEVDVARFLAVCGTTGAEYDRLMGLVGEQHLPSWFQQHGALLPAQLRTLVGHENRAVSIAQFEALGVPGLVQTSSYARAVISGIVNMPRDEVDSRVAARMERQALLVERRLREVTFYLHEHAVRTPVGGAVVMAEQLRRLVQVAGRPKVTLRVVPTALGAHPGMAGSFRLMEFADIRPVAYIECQTASLFLERVEEIRTYRTILAALDRCALDPADSVALLGSIANGFATEEARDDDG